MFLFLLLFFFFFRKLSAPKKVSGDETVSSGSEPEKQRNQKRVLPLGTAETKKLAKKGKGQQKTRKRKAEGLNGILLHIMCGYQCDKAVNKNYTREVI